MATQYTWTRVQQEVLKALKAAIGKVHAPTIDELTTPPDTEIGEIAYPCFALAKGLSRNPAEIATELAAKIGPKGMIARVTSSGPYVNIQLKLDVFASDVFKNIELSKERYGYQNLGKGRRIMVEYANPNTHKDVHVGHVRNFVVGYLTIQLLRAVGYDVVAASYINDLGNNVAKCVWSMQALHEGERPESGHEIEFLQKLYVEAGEAAEKDETVREEISTIQRSLETGRGPWHKLWKESRQWSIDALYAAFKEFHLPIDRQYYESELIDDTKKIVRDLQERGTAKLNDGAIIVDLSDEDLGVNLLVKSDGALLYNAKDLALAMRKSTDYDLDRSLIVVDERQSLAMRQLFATLKHMGVQIPYEHLSYNFVTLPEGAMSSRKGTIVRYESLRDRLRHVAADETREKHADWSASRVEKAAHAVAHAALVYSMAKQDPKKDLTFSVEEAVAFEGNTGPYLLYTTSRISSLLAKASIEPAMHDGVLGSPERALVLHLAQYPSVVAASAQHLTLSDVPNYAFNLAQMFSTYYNDVRIIDEEKPAVSATRLALCRAVLITLGNALRMMGLEPLEEM